MPVRMRALLACLVLVLARALPAAAERSSIYVSVGGGATDLNAGVSWALGNTPFGAGAEAGIGWVFMGRLDGFFHLRPLGSERRDVFVTVGYAELGSSEFSSRGVTVGGGATWWLGSRVGVRGDGFRYVPASTHNEIPAHERSPSRYWGVRAGLAIRLR